NDVLALGRREHEQRVRQQLSGHGVHDPGRRHRDQQLGRMTRELAASAVAALVLTGTSAASWSGSGAGSAATRATTMGAGNAPSASAPTLSTNVTVSWTRASYGNGALV